MNDINDDLKSIIKNKARIAPKNVKPYFSPVSQKRSWNIAKAATKQVKDLQRRAFSWKYEILRLRPWKIKNRPDCYPGGT